MEKDYILIGVLSGIIGNFVKVLTAGVLQLLKLTKYSYYHFAAGFFIPDINQIVSNPLALTLGFISDFAMGALLGIFLVYIFKYLAGNHYLLKGLIYGVFIHVIFFGLIMKYNICSIRFIDPLHNLIFIIPHTVFGIVVALTAARLYERSLT